MTKEQIEYFSTACKSLEADDIDITSIGVGKGFGGLSNEGESNLRRWRRALYDKLEEIVYEENKHG